MSALFPLDVTDALLSTTRAVRKRLDLARPVEREVLLECIGLSQQAPTGSNMQGWRWVVVTDEGKRAELARICMEGKPNAVDYSGDLFRSQESLTAERVLALAAPYAEPEDLEHCMDSAATQEKLRDDIDWALEHRIRGTPLVLVNGRAAPASATFLYALILSRGDADHPVFQALTLAETAER